MAHTLPAFSRAWKYFIRFFNHWKYRLKIKSLDCLSFSSDFYLTEKFKSVSCAPLHSERREVNARQPDNQRCHGLAKGDAPRKGKVDGQPHLSSPSLKA